MGVAGGGEGDAEDVVALGEEGFVFVLLGLEFGDRF